MKLKIRYRANPHDGYGRCIQVQFYPRGKWRNIRDSEGRVVTHGTVEEAGLMAIRLQDAAWHTINA